MQKALSIIVRDQSTGNRNNNLAIIENSGIFLETLKNYSIKYDLARSCFQLWPKIGDEGDRDSFFLEILSPSEPILRAKIENMISPDYVLCYIPRAMAILS